MIMQPYSRKVFQSMRVPTAADGNLIKGAKKEITCAPFCRMMRYHMGWDGSLSYRVPGKIYPEQKLVKFDLTKSAAIANNVEEAQNGDFV